jgi:hypothetical protein
MGNESQNSLCPKSRLDLISKWLLLAIYKYASSALLGATGSQVTFHAGGLGFLQNKEEMILCKFKMFPFLLFCVFTKILNQGVGRTS